MIIVKYTGKKLKPGQYIVTSFAQRSAKEGHGFISSFRYFEDERFPYGFWNKISPFENPSVLDIKRNHEPIDRLPDELKWHIFTAIFGGEDFKDICQLIRLKG